MTDSLINCDDASDEKVVYLWNRIYNFVIANKLKLWREIKIKGQNDAIIEYKVYKDDNLIKHKKRRAWKI
jgi:hypothetical protein